MPTLHLMIGLPGIGKSTRARGLMKGSKDTIVVSSDDLRSVLLQDIDRQDENKLIFGLMQDMTISAMLQGKNVIYDATNLWEDKRRLLVNSIKEKVEGSVAIATYCVGTHLKAINNNGNRMRKVPTDVIMRMTKQFDVPTKRDLDYLDEVKYSSIDTFGWSSLENLLDVRDYEEFNETMRLNIKAYEPNIDLAQDCPYHSLSVSRHIYAAFDYARKNMPVELVCYREHILYALAFHDVGKAICKTFRVGSKYAHFTGHEKVSAQVFMAESMRHKCINNMESNISNEFVAALIKEHGFPYKNKDEDRYNEALEDIRILYGKDFRDCLIFLRECDQAAK